MYQEALLLLRDEQSSWTGGMNLGEVSKLIKKMRKRVGLMEEEDVIFENYCEEKKKKRRERERRMKQSVRKRKGDAWGDDEGSGRDGEKKEEEEEEEERRTCNVDSDEEEEEDEDQVHSDNNHTPPFYSFYQASDGSLIFLHPLQLSCVLEDQCSSDDDEDEGGDLPEMIEAEILELTDVLVTEEEKRSHSWLAHLPIGVTVRFVEVSNFSNFVKDSTWRKFKSQFEERERWRAREGRRKEREEEERGREEHDMRELHERKVAAILKRREDERLEAVESFSENPHIIMEEGGSPPQPPINQGWSFARVMESGGHFPDLHQK